MSDGNDDIALTEALEELCVRWESAAQYAKDADNIQEYDGIMGCVTELNALLEDYE